MKYLLVAFLTSFYSSFLFAQTITYNAQSFKSIDPKDTTYSDLEVIQGSIGNARVVLLGEPSHQEGNVFLAKTRIAKMLNQKMGFNILAFESGFYDLAKAQQKIDDGEDVYECVENAIYPIWIRAKEFEPLIDFIENKKIRLVGFDSQIGGEYSTEYLTDELNQFIKNNIREQNQIDYQMFDEVLLYMNEYFMFPDNNSYSTYTKSLKKIRASLSEIHSTSSIENIKSEASFWLQCISSIESLAKDYKVNDPGSMSEADFKAKDSNQRDLQMAKNLMYWLEKYPHDKFICWGASAHFALYIEQLENEELKEYVPMGRTLKDMLGDKVFSIAFTTSGGNYGYWYENEYKTVPIPEKSSFEYALAIDSLEYIWMDLSHNTKKMTTSILDYTPLKGDWSKVFDGIVYIKEFTPVHPSVRESKKQNDVEEDTNKEVFAKKSNGTDTEETKTITKLIRYNSFGKAYRKVFGKIIDHETNQVIPYATVQLTGTSIGTSANQYGLFELKLPQRINHDTLTISCIGYKQKYFKLENDPATLLIKMYPEIKVLKSVTVSADKFDPLKIMREAIKAIPINYLTNNFGAEYYTHVWEKNFDSALVDFEYVGQLYYENGYIRKNNNRITAQVKKVKWNHRFKEKNISNRAFLNGFWVTRIDFVKSHPIFSTSRLKNFNFSLTDITSFNNDDVYEISFVSKKNNHANTNDFYDIGFSGKIYIKDSDKAVLKCNFFWQRDTTLLNKYNLKYFAQGKSDWWNKSYTNYQIKQTVVYEKSPEGYYFLNNSYTLWDTEGASLITGKNINIKSQHHVYISKIQENNVLPIVFQENDDFDLNKPFDSQFWEQYNVPVSGDLVNFDFNERK
ncbi:MAG TPA: erythromycin esterase family protein [Fulvivirga sp.]|nr:erythromycin esterase family protein [Fulvivirga sp.]